MEDEFLHKWLVRYMPMSKFQNEKSWISERNILGSVASKIFQEDFKKYAHDNQGIFLQDKENSTCATVKFVENVKVEIVKLAKELGEHSTANDRINGPGMVRFLNRAFP